MGQFYFLREIVLRKRNQRKNAKDLQISTTNSIVEGCYVKIGGIDQWITIRGENRNNPVLLLIHGGPASTYSIFSPLLRSWEKHFIVVQWDQRGAGKTFGKNGKEGSGAITFDRLAEDGIEVAEYLRDKFGHQKVILIGSSVGSLIGIMMAKVRPELFYAYVGTDQNAPDSQNLVYTLSVNAFRGAGITRGVQLLEKMGADQSQWSRKDFDKKNRLIVKTIKDVPNMITDLILPSMLSSPEHKIRDMMDIFKGMSYSLDHLFNELINFDFKKYSKFEVPVFIFHGDHDIITPTELARAYYDDIEAPQKEFVLIKNAGHLACFARPNQFLDELIKRVRPLVPSTIH
ncbi:alpha/beta fold hydrolase [Neobacillus rhizophilus]|uniref:Alpha/beta hydrolase n=1 Tax=Neobacillus rhizophilus TaxID=2833579 RepID=A0A942U7T1_9BACI|nr:alpha/beta hydrolase [Neobacillus rhizophilus]MBS4215045.1 alpha/beta hydrolase [Neobacillus rhizophilus]MBU8919201.1 alpha/beta hydrolase [Bacillus sp. FJAT-29953]